MKHILIPTDFSIASLQAVHTAIAHYPATEIKITMLHLLDMPSGIGDLLIRTVRREPTHLINSEFKKACEIIRNKYNSKIKELNVVFRYGTTKNYVQNLLEGLNVDTIAYDPSHKYKSVHADSVNMIPLLKRSGYEVVETRISNKANTLEHVSFGSLLLKDAVQTPQGKLSGA